MYSDKQNKMIWTLFVLISLGGVLSQECGKGKLSNAKPSREIFEPKKVEVGEFPWQASIEIGSAFGEQHRCSGAILDKQWVIAPAQCTYGLTSSSGIIKVGKTYLKDSTPSEQIRALERSYKNPSFGKQMNYQYDVALIKLEKPLEFNENVSSICLPNQNQDFSATVCESSGWDVSLQTDNIWRPILRKINVNVLPKGQCSDKRVISDKNLCAGGMTASGKGVCNRDNGGLLQCKTGNTYVLTGIANKGNLCLKAGVPDMYTNIGAFSDWIKETMKKNQ